MVDFAEPKILIGGVPITAQDFRWMLSSGVMTYYRKFSIPAGPIHDNLLLVQNPTYIEIEVYGGTNQYKSEKLRIENVHLVKPIQKNEWWYEWVVADSRYIWEGKKVFRAWNKTRIRNQYGLNPNTDITDPRILREQFDKFAKGRYLSWSVRDDQLPFTVYEMMIQIFQDYGIQYEDDPSGREKSYVMENVEFNGVDIRKALSQLCAMSRMNIGILPNGKLYVFSVDFYDENPISALMIQKDKHKVSSGTLYRQDLKRRRPRKIRVRFQKKQEVLCIGVNAPDEFTSLQDPPLRTPISNERLLEAGYLPRDFLDRNRVVPVVNVIPLPYPITHRGRVYNIGEYMPIQYLFEALGIEEDFVRYAWFSGSLSFAIDRILHAGQKKRRQLEVLSVQITNAIKNHYRQTWMMDTYFMDTVEKWEATRCTVIDNFRRYSPPSPVFMDYAIIPGVRPINIANRTSIWSQGCRNWIVNEDDPDRKQPVPYTINVTNHDLGVFSLSKPPLLDKVIDDLIPSAIENPPIISLAADRIVYQNTHLLPSHTFETIISVVWATGESTRKYDSPEKYYFYEFDYAGKLGPSQGPEIEFLSTLEYARMKSNTRDPELISLPEEIPINQDILAAIASAEAAKLIFQFRDRIVGIVTVAGLIQNIRLDGNMKNIGFEFSSAMGARTTFDLRDIPIMPTIEQRVPQHVINFLRRHVPRGEDLSSAGVK